MNGDGERERAAPITIKQVIRNPATDEWGNYDVIRARDSWRVIWGPTSGQNGRMQLIESFALGTDGLTVVPLVIDANGLLVQAGTISADYKIDHPQHFTRVTSGYWEPGY